MAIVNEYFIYNKERSEALSIAYWWMPNKFGYTEHVENAGRYTEAEARQIVADSRGGDLMVAVEDVLNGGLTTLTCIDIDMDNNRAGIEEFGRQAWEAAN